MKDWKFLYEKYVLGKHHHNGFPEPQVVKSLRNMTGDLFVDVGANQGMYARKLQYNFDRIYCFEPNPAIEHLLVENLSRIHRTRTRFFPIALSDKTGTTMFYRDPHNGFNGSADTILPVFEYRPARTGFPDNIYMGKDGIEVETDTYDNQVDQEADLVKVDVEGAEFLVLEGMKNSLRQKHVRRIVVELHDRLRANELEEVLTNYGFITRWSDPDHILGELASWAEYRTV